MATYLLVGHQTVQSDELLEVAKRLRGDDEAAEFVLLVPATPVAKLLTWEEGETAEVAQRHAEAGRARLEEHGLTVRETAIGDPDPVVAIGDVLRERRHAYAAIVLSTLPPGLSRWLRMDVISRAQRRFAGHRVIHVVSRQPAARSATR
jgi:hypothetical protein